MVDRVIHTAGGQIVEDHGSNYVETAPAEQPGILFNEAAGNVFRSGPNGDEVVPVTYRFSSADLVPTDSESILDSARWHGTPVKVGPHHDPSTITVINPETGMETSLEVALQMGLVHRSPMTGAYVNGPDPESVGDQQETQQQVEPQPVAFDAQGEDNLRALVDAYQPEMQASLMEAAISGRIESQLNDYAGAGGMTPEELAGRVNQAMQAFQQQADAVVRQQGHDPAKVWEWLREVNPEYMLDTMRRHVGSRDPSVWAEVARQYARKAPRSADDLRAAGYEVRMSSDGRPLVVINGAELEAEAAAMMGLI